jgi:hypothetical protein
MHAASACQAATSHVAAALRIIGQSIRQTGRRRSAIIIGLLSSMVMLSLATIDSLRSVVVRAGSDAPSFRLARIYGNTRTMSKSIKVAPKKRGRPPSGGRDPIVPTRFPEETIAAIDAWAANAGASRSEAIRSLVDLGLKTRKLR